MKIKLNPLTTLLFLIAGLVSCSSEKQKAPPPAQLEDDWQVGLEFPQEGQDESLSETGLQMDINTSIHLKSNAPERLRGVEVLTQCSFPPDFTEVEKTYQQENGAPIQLVNLMPPEIFDLQKTESSPLYCELKFTFENDRGSQITHELINVKITGTRIYHNIKFLKEDFFVGDQRKILAEHLIGKKISKNFLVSELHLLCENYKGVLRTSDSEVLLGQLIETEEDLKTYQQTCRLVEKNQHKPFDLVVGEPFKLYQAQAPVELVASTIYQPREQVMNVQNLTFARWTFKNPNPVPAIVKGEFRGDMAFRWRSLFHYINKTNYSYGPVRVVPLRARIYLPNGQMFEQGSGPFSIDLQPSEEFTLELVGNLSYNCKRYLEPRYKCHTKLVYHHGFLSDYLNLPNLFQKNYLTHPDELDMFVKNLNLTNPKFDGFAFWSPMPPPGDECKFSGSEFVPGTAEHPHLERLGCNYLPF